MCAPPVAAVNGFEVLRLSHDHDAVHMEVCAICSTQNCIARGSTPILVDSTRWLSVTAREHKCWHRWGSVISRTNARRGGGHFDYYATTARVFSHDEERTDAARRTRLVNGPPSVSFWHRKPRRQVQYRY